MGKLREMANAARSISSRYNTHRSIHTFLCELSIMRLADLHRAVQTTLSSKRLGTPVFARYLLQTPDKPAAVANRLAQIAAVVRDWLGQPVERIYALGSTKNGQVTLTVEFRDAAAALISWSSGRGAVDLTLIGNHGALYHDGGAANLWDDGLTALDDKPDANLLVWIERALRSGRPEAE